MRDIIHTLTPLLNTISKPRILLNLKCSIYILYFYSIIALDEVLREQHKAQPRCWAGMGCSPGRGWGAGMSSSSSKAGSSVERTVQVPRQVVISQSLAHPPRASAGFKHDSAPTRIFISSSIRPRHHRNGSRQASWAKTQTYWLAWCWLGNTDCKIHGEETVEEGGVLSQGAASGSRTPTEPQTGPPKPWGGARSHGCLHCRRGCMVQVKW